MRISSAIPAQLVAAYEAAQYRVEADPPFVLRIGERNEAMGALLAIRGLSSGAFVTACNPAGQLLEPADNVARAAALERDLQRFAPALLPATGVDPTGRWPDETGFFVLGCPPAIVEALGRRHGQNAIVLCDEDAVPRLVLLR